MAGSCLVLAKIDRHVYIGKRAPITSRRAAMPAHPRKDELAEKALELFDRDGFHAVGIDRIIAEAGVAKMTLYNNFASKEALILEALRRRQEGFGRWLFERAERAGPSPRARLLGVFDALGEWFAAKGFHGCLFIRAAGEYPALGDPVHRFAARHKQALRRRLGAMAAEAGVVDAEGLSHQLAILVDGAIVAAQVAGRREAAADARRAATALLDAAGAKK
jgi:AcrR family transcriptional regulator